MGSFSVFTGYCRSEICRRGLLVKDQHRSVARTLPWLYLLIISQQMISMTNVTMENLSFPVVFVFAALVIFSAMRTYYWWKNRNKFEAFSTAHKVKDLRSVTIMAPVLAGFFSALASYTYLQTGNLEEAFTAISIVTLSLAGAFSLYVLPVAAISALVAALAPLSLTFLFWGDGNLSTLGALLLAVLIFSVFLLVQNFKNFADTVCSQIWLEEEKLASQRAAASVERLAYFDALTDLPNRRKFVQLLDKAQGETRNGAPGFAVAVIDIVGFKSIDDAYGRTAGDVLLRQVAHRLLSLNDKFTDKINHVARLGGDEFVFVVPAVESVDQAHDFGKILCKTFKEEFHLPEASVSLSFSCGLALFPSNDGDPDRLIARADLARSFMVEQSRDVVGVFSPEMETARLREASVKQALGVAIAQGDIFPCFQPIVRIDNGEIAGFEALARWNDQKLGNVSPGEFIEIAEKSQFIEELTMDLFRKSLDVAKRWPANTKLYYNLSAKLLGRQKSIEKLLAILETSGFPPSQLEIELTETAVMDDINLARRQMQKFKDAGVGIALDDFGSGYSSLGQIRDLPLDKVKIDKSFTDQICTDAKIRNIVAALVQLCRQIDIVCVVEGIETLEQLGLLSDMGCELGQGYLFSKPIPASKTTRRVQLVNAA